MRCGGSDEGAEVCGWAAKAVKESEMKTANTSVLRMFETPFSDEDVGRIYYVASSSD